MAATGKAAVFHGAGEPFEVRELPLPPVEPQSILVKISATGICGSDLHYWRGDMRVIGTEPGPLVTGHEMTGRVYQLGSGIRTDSLGQPLKEGDRVVFHYVYPCMRCYQCLRGDLSACPHKYRYRASVNSYPYCSGGYAEYNLLHPGHFVFKAPEGLPDEALVPVNCALSQVIDGLHRAGLRMGDPVVLQGAGGLGIFAAAAAREMGAGTIIAIDGIPARLALARACGADSTVDINAYSEPEARIQRVLELTPQRRGADVVMELVGLPQVIPEGLRMVRRGGTFVEIGTISEGHVATLDIPDLIRREVRILAMLNYNPWVLPVALDFLVRTRDKYPLSQVVSHRFPLEQINQAFQQAEWLGRQGQTQVTRAIIVP